jgi:hypothetical protein
MEGGNVWALSGCIDAAMVILLIIKLLGFFFLSCALQRAIAP